MSRASWRVPLRWRWPVGAATLVAVVWWTGSGPVATGLRALDPQSLALAAAIASVSTVACAWRWHLVARELGVAIPVPRAVAACYRAQLLNSVLPGGVLGDVHRGVVHGRSAGATGAALRAVAWERVAGQVVQLVLALGVLLLLPSPVRGFAPAAAGLVVPAVLVAILLARRPAAGGGRWWRRALRIVHQDVRCGLLVRRAWPGVVVASTVAVAGHVATYVVAARAVGVTAPVTTLLPLAALVLTAAGLPLNVAGWGPREGVAAWAFAAAGLGAGVGVSVAVAYGAMVLVANLPGAVVLAATSRPAPGRLPLEAGLPARPAGIAAGGGSRA